MSHPNKTCQAQTCGIIHFYLLQQKCASKPPLNCKPGIILLLFVSYSELDTWLVAAVFTAPGVSLCHCCLPPCVQRSATVLGLPLMTGNNATG